MMSANTFPREAPLAEPVKQQHEEVGKEEGGESEKMGKSKKRGERRKNKKVEATTAAPTGITPPSPQLPTAAPITSTITIDLPATREDNQPLLASTPVLPPSFIFGPITTTFGQSPPASLTLPPVNQPLPFAFGPVTTAFTQATPPPPSHKTFTEVEVNLQLTAAKAVAKTETDDEIVALTKELEASKEELATLKEESSSRREELAKARAEQKLTQEALDAAERRLSTINACLDKQKTELDSEQSVRQGLEAELVVTREALVACNKKLSPTSGMVRLGRRRLPLLLFALFLAMLVCFWCTWASMMQLPLAVVSRIDSAHMYPEEMSMAWMAMDEFGWFGD